MARTIAIANLKGGVGKTTTTISLGAALAERGHRVLLVDLDTQQDLCTSLGAPTPRPGLADVLFSVLAFEKARLSEAFVQVCGMTIVGGYGLAHAETQLSPYRDSETALKLALAPQSHLFDFVLLDCAPSIGYLTLSALTAASEVLVPIQTEYLAMKQLSGTMSTVEGIKAKLNPKLKVIGFIPTMYDSRTRHSLEILEEIAVQAKRYQVPAFKPIPKTIRFAEAAATGKPISHFAPESAATLAYEALAPQIELYREPEEIPLPPPARFLATPTPAPGYRVTYL